MGSTLVRLERTCKRFDVHYVVYHNVLTTTTTPGIHMYMQQNVRHAIHSYTEN